MTRTRITLCLALASAGAVGTAGAAKPKIPPIIPDWKQSHLEEGDPAITSVYILAVCARNHKRPAAEAFLAAAPGSAEEAALMATLVPSGETDCPIRPGTLRIRGTTLVRGALSEAIYNGDGIRPRTAEPLPLNETFEAGRGGSPFPVGGWVARCAVHRNPSLAHAVLKYNAGSPGERRALLALGPVFVGCLPPGARLGVSRIVMRMLIAQELYRASVDFREAFVHA